MNWPVRALNFAVNEGGREEVEVEVEDVFVEEVGRRVGSRCAREGSIPAAMAAA